MSIINALLDPNKSLGLLWIIDWFSDPGDQHVIRLINGDSFILFLSLHLGCFLKVKLIYPSILSSIVRITHGKGISLVCVGC